MRCNLYPVGMKHLLRRLLLTFLCSAVPVFAAAPAPSKAAAPLLPPAFGEWHLAAAPRTGASPEAADSANAAVLREDGLTQFAAGTYRAADPKAPSVDVRAYRFADATGAFAAFTLYRRPGMRALHIGAKSGPGNGDNAAADGPHVLLWDSATLLDCTLSRDDAAAVGALSMLVAAMPRVGGSAAIPPPLPSYLPTESLEPGSVRYSIGPAAYAVSGNPVPAEVIDFSRDAEVVTGTYRLRGGGAETGTMTLVMYPTPQLAINREHALNAFASGLNGGKGPGPDFAVKRLGAMLAYTGGSLSKAEADRLLGGIRYKTEVIINHPEGYVSEVAKAAKLLLGIGYLTGILGVGAVILALFLGAGRVLVRKLRGKPVSSMNDDDFISLKIDG